MNNTITLYHRRYLGTFGYLTQEGGETLHFEEKIDCVVFYDFENGKRKTISWISMIPSEAPQLDFMFESKKAIQKITKHRTADSIKPNEIFSYVKDNNSLFIHAKAIDLSITYTKKEARKEHKIGDTNYYLYEHQLWLGGANTKIRTSDMGYLYPIKTELEQKMKELMFLNLAWDEGADKCIALLEEFKGKIQVHLKYWEDTSPEDIINGKEIKKEGGDN